MYGAILGDMIGSPYEFDKGDKTKKFPLFSKKAHFTDDTVMTIAVAEALLDVGSDANREIIHDAVTHAMPVDQGEKSKALRQLRQWLCHASKFCGVAI